MAEIVLLGVLWFVAVVLAVSAMWFLFFAGRNVVAVLLVRWRCHGSLAHPAKAHANDKDFPPWALNSPPLWRAMFRQPLIPIRRRR
jgi:hypothetical protein